MKLFQLHSTSCCCPDLCSVPEAAHHTPAALIVTISLCGVISPCLCAAKQYIEQLRAAAAVAGQDDEDVDGQLAEEAAEAHGRLNRQIAAKLDIPVYQTSDGNYGKGTFVRGDKLSSTAVTLSSDDSKAYTTSKCGCVTIWDIENSSRYDATLYRTCNALAKLTRKQLCYGTVASKRSCPLSFLCTSRVETGRGEVQEAVVSPRR